MNFNPSAASSTSILYQQSIGSSIQSWKKLRIQTVTPYVPFFSPPNTLLHPELKSPPNQVRSNPLEEEHLQKIPTFFAKSKENKTNEASPMQLPNRLIPAIPMLFPTTSLSCITLKKKLQPWLLWHGCPQVQMSNENIVAYICGKQFYPRIKRHHSARLRQANTSSDTTNGVEPESSLGRQVMANSQQTAWWWTPLEPSCYKLALCSWHSEHSKSLTWLQHSANQRRTYLRGRVINTL